MPHFDFRGSIMCWMAACKTHGFFGFWKAGLMEEKFDSTISQNRNGASGAHRFHRGFVFGPAIDTLDYKSQGA